MVERYSKWVISNPKKTLLISLGLIQIFIFGAAFIKADFGFRIWFQPKDPLMVRFDEFQKRFENDDTTVVVLHDSKGVFNSKTIKSIQELTEKFYQVSDVLRVDSLSHFPLMTVNGDDINTERVFPIDVPLSTELIEKKKKLVLENNLLKNFIISEDGKTTSFFITLKPMLDRSPDYMKVMDDITKTINPYTADSDIQFFVTGSAAMDQAFRDTTVHDLAIQTPLVIILMASFLYFMFRRKSGVILPFATIGLAIGAIFGLSGWLGFKFNNLIAMVPSLMLAISIGGCIHILFYFYKSLENGSSREQAAYDTLKHNIYPTFFTMFSSVIGFFSGAITDIIPLQHLAILAGLGVIVSWILAVCVLPALLVLLPLKPRKILHKETEDTKPWARDLVHRISNHRKKIIGSFLIIFALSIYIASKNTVNSDPSRFFKSDLPLVVANSFIEKNLGASGGVEVVIETGEENGITQPELLKKVEVFQKWLEAKPWVTKTISIVDVIKHINHSLNGGKDGAFKIPDSREEVAQQIFLYTMGLPEGQSLNNRMTLKQDALRVSIFWKLKSSSETLSEITRIETKLYELGLKGGTNGKQQLFENLVPHVVDTFFSSFSITLTAIALLLILTFKSFRFGLLGMLPNVIPIAVGGAIFTLMGRSIDIGTVMVADICLGVAVDDTIHLVTNFRNYRKEGLSDHEAMARCLSNSGMALLISNLTLVAGFISFIAASFVPTVNFGVAAAMILTIALSCELFLMPALFVQKRKL